MKTRREKEDVVHIIRRVRGERFEDVLKHVDDQSAYVYCSLARPFWLGLMTDLNTYDVVKTNDTRVVQTQKPLPMNFLVKSELFPISDAAKRHAMGESLLSDLSIVLFNNSTGRLLLAWQGNGKVFASELQMKGFSQAEQVFTAEYELMSDAVVALMNRQIDELAAGEFSVLDLDSVASSLSAEIDAAIVLNEIGKIRRGQHPLYVNGDRLLNADDFIFKLVDRDSERAERLATEWARAMDLYSEQSGMPEMRISQTISDVQQMIKNKVARDSAPKQTKKEGDMVTKQRWIDLSAHGVYLGDQAMADNRSRLVVLDMNNRGDARKLAEIGFLPLKGSPRYEKGIYYLHGEDQRMRPKALAAAFGLSECPIVEVDVKEIGALFRSKIAEKFAANINSIVMRSQSLGTNKAGQPVFLSPLGRMIRVSQDNAVVEGSEHGKQLGKTAFLRADNDADLRECAHGFIWAIRQGQKMAWPDLVRFGKAVFDSPKGESPSDEQMHRLQEAVEAAGYQRFAEVANMPDEAAFKAALELYFGLPTARMRTSESVLLQQYSTPLPMSVVGQRLLIGNDAVMGKSAYDPTAGNGGLLTLLPKSMRKFAVELDRKRYETLVEDGGIQAVLADATNFNARFEFDNAGLDYVISNPPFGSMDSARTFDRVLEVRKLDHYIPLQALEARKDQGRAVIIFGADSTQSDGTIKGSTTHFLNYIYDHYDVHGFTEVDGRLYSRHGAGLNVRMLVIGDRRVNKVECVVPQKLDIITTYDELWAWSSRVIDRYQELSPRDLAVLPVKVGDEVKFTTHRRDNSFETGVVEGQLIAMSKVFGAMDVDYKCEVRTNVPRMENDGFVTQTFMMSEGTLEKAVEVVNVVTVDEDDIAISADGVHVSPVFGNPDSPAVVPATPVKKEFTAAPFENYVRERAAMNAVKLRPLPGKQFSDEEVSQLRGWLVENGWVAITEKNYVRGVGPVGAVWDDVPQASRFTKAAQAELERATKEDATKDARAEKIAADLERLPSVPWLNELFDQSILNRANRVALARYLDGEDAEFQGIASAWLNTAASIVEFEAGPSGSINTSDVLPLLKNKYEVSQDLELVASAGNDDNQEELVATAKEWIDRHFSLESVLDHNRAALVTFLIGDGQKGSYQGRVDRSWLPGLALMGMSDAQIQTMTVDSVLDNVYRHYQSFLAEQESDLEAAEGILRPWEMAKQQWDKEMTEGLGKDPATDEARRAFLRYDVTAWASEKAALVKAGQLTLSDEELADITDRLASPVTHRDVIDKALGEGKRVPMEVLAAYPDLSADNKRSINEFQVPYQPASKVGAPSTMIPINMSGATYAALNALEARHGPIDDYVASRLQFDVADLGKYFSPEQVDAVGLGILAIEDGRGIINADQTGIGKGRFVGAMLRYAKLNGKTPVFLTIKPELFTDIFRDINDVGSLPLFKKLFIFNDGEYVRKFGTEKEVLFPKTTPVELAKAIENGGVDEDVDMVLATYSQFMRQANKNKKANLLTQIVSNNGVLLLDESHVAAGESNLADTVGQAVANSTSVVYSSATPLKGVSNFSIYSKVLPESVNVKSLADTLKAGGEPLQEAISANMARDGVLVRREHDFSKLTFHTKIPGEQRLTRNRDLADQLSSILAEMSYLSGDVEKKVSDLNKGYKQEWEEIPDKDRTGFRMQASSMNFGSRLYNINRQFLMGVKIEDAVEEALNCLGNGQKPIIAVENTGESLLRQVVARRAGVGALEAELLEIEERGASRPEDKDRRSVLVSRINDAMRNVVLDDAPQFRELLEIMLDRIGTIKIQDRYGKYSESKPESKEYFEAEAALRDRIREFPNLPLTPIDIIKNELEKVGHPVAEVSGRKASLVPSEFDASRWNVAFHPKHDAVASVAGFQNGKYDCIVITRSGSTGISLHATDRFADSDIRQRNFIVLQKAANIAEFLQWMGRANRKDQVIPPVISNIESGLPAELRLTMMHNTKLRKLSANTTSNRNNANIEGDDCDLLNEVGDRVALDWLIDNRDIASVLDIVLPNDEELEGKADGRFAQDCPYINKLMGRLALVSVSKQEEILKALSNRFLERVEELEQRGENPFKVDVRDWKAVPVKEESLQTGVIRASRSSFDEPVKMVTLQYEQTIYPVKSDKLISMVEMGLESYNKMAPEGETDPVRKLRAYMLSVQDAFIRSQLPQKLRESTEPLYVLLENKEVAAAKNAKERSEFLLANMTYFKPGQKMVYVDQFKGERSGVIVSVQFPHDRDEMFMLSKYRARVLFPGEDHSQEVTLATVFSQGQTLDAHKWYKIDPSQLNVPSVRRTLQPIFDEFDNAPEGTLTRMQYVLQGNLFRACELAAQEKLGSSILYTDGEGNRQRAVLLKSFVTPEVVKSLPISLDAKDTADYAKEFLRANHPMAWSRSRFGALTIFGDTVAKDMKPGEGIMLQVLNGGRAVRLSMPGTKARAGELMSDGRIFHIGEKTPPNSLGLKLSGTRNCMSVEFPLDQLGDVLNRMQRYRHVGKFAIQAPDQEVLELLKERHTKEMEARRGGKFKVDTEDSLSL